MIISVEVLDVVEGFGLVGSGSGSCVVVCVGVVGLDCRYCVFYFVGIGGVLMGEL